MSALLAIVRREVARATRSLRGAVRRGTLGTGASSSYTAQVQGLDDETWEGAELWQQYGLASRPPTGGEVVIAEVDGAGEGAVIVATQDRAHRPTIDADEVVLYGKKGAGQPTVRLKNTGAVDLTPGDASFVDVGGAAAADFLLKGTTWWAANSLLWNLISFAFVTISAPAGPILTIGAAFTALGADPALATPTKNACNSAATACTTLTTVFGATIPGFIATYLVGSYLAAKSKVL